MQLGAGEMAGAGPYHSASTRDVPTSPVRCGIPLESRASAANRVSSLHYAQLFGIAKRWRRLPHEVLKRFANRAGARNAVALLANASDKLNHRKLA